MNKKEIIIAILLFIIVSAIIIVSCSITTIPTGFVGVKTRFGKVQDDVIQEGLNIKTPFIEKIVKIDCKTRKIETESGGSTKDLQTVTIKVAINYNVNKLTANKLYREVGIDFENVIVNPAILESIKSAMAQYNAEELITKRAEVSNKIEETIIGKISARGFDVTEFNVINIDFSQEFDQAIERKAVKQQEVATAQAELEKQKIQNEKEISEAEKDARVMELQNQQITELTLRLKQLENERAMIDKWNGAYPSTMISDGSNTLLNIGGQ